MITMTQMALAIAGGLIGSIVVIAVDRITSRWVIPLYQRWKSRRWAIRNQQRLDRKQAVVTQVSAPYKLEPAQPVQASGMEGETRAVPSLQGHVRDDGCYEVPSRNAVLAEARKRAGQA